MVVVAAAAAADAAVAAVAACCRNGSSQGSCNSQGYSSLIVIHVSIIRWESANNGTDDHHNLYRQLE